ncbi:Ribosomal protein L1/ribosomal biogenesis protein [Phytophthora cactorum]|nr:Ribosomal protein L1/ribosomal biogenesis protein [Phytophthora cactorum]
MTDVTIRKGLRNPLDEAQVRRAVLALQTFAAKKSEEQAKTPLVEDVDYVSCILTRKLVPAKASLKPIPITLPHALYDASAEICLFVKDEDKKRIKEALAKDPVQGVTKIMTVKKLRKNFSRFEDKRALAAAYDMFLADDRVLPYLKGPLGTKFFVKKKQPVAVRVSRKDVANSVRLAARRTAFHVSAGVCNNVKVARLDMMPEQIVDNIMVAMNNCASLVPKGWNGVQSISVKLADSVALPVYNALASLAKLPAVGKTANLKKRKLEEFIAEADEEAEAPKTKKQGKKEEAPPAKKAKKPAKVEEAAEEAPKKQNKKAKKEDKPAETTTPPAKRKVRGKKKVSKNLDGTSELQPLQRQREDISRNSPRPFLSSHERRLGQSERRRPSSREKREKQFSVTMAMFSARGLNNFISELRACTSREEEQKRVDKELGKIRQKFTQTASNSGLGGGGPALQSYDRKKYAWKLIYIYMLGYDVDFGHVQIISLVSGSKYSEKCLGYLGCSILLKASDELMTLVINSIRNDLKSREASSQCLALCCVANLGGADLSETMGPDVAGLLTSSASIAHVRKKAALCARRLLPDNPELLPVEDMENRLNDLMGETHLGVVTSAAGLLQTSLSLHPTAFRSLIEPCIQRLNALVTHKNCPRDYMYYNAPCPWLQVKLLRILQQFHANGALDADSADGRLNNMLNETLHRVLARTPPGKSAKNNAAYSVLIEAVNLVIARGKPGGDTESPAYKLREQAVALLARFISVTEPNIRYVGLDSMYRMVRLDGDGTSVKQHQETVLFSLKDADPSVRRRALDLLFAMCDATNAQEIVGELVNYLAVAERTMSTVPTTGPVSGIREEIVLKAAILAEKYARDLRWYVDTVLQLLTIAGSEVPDAVWHRVVQIVTNREELQRYAAEQMFKAMEPRYVDETTTKFGAYVLGEFGYLLCDDASMSGTRSASDGLCKMDNLYEELRSTVHGVLAKAASNMNLEIQQRACEYLALRQLCQSSPNGEEVLRAVLEPMPVFPENRESGLIVRLRNQQKAAAGGDGAVLPEEGAVSPRTSSAFGMGGQDAIRGPNPASTDLGDIFGGGSSGGKPVGLDASLTPQIAVWARNLMLNPQGVLVETDVLQIGAKHEYRGSQGRINLFYGNKTRHAQRFSVQLGTGNLFRVQSEELPSQLTGKQQAKQQIMIEAMAPFTEPPIMTVNFSRNGTSYSYQVALPCQATSFMEPDHEQQEVVPAASKLDMTQAREWLRTNLNFAMIDGLDSHASRSLSGAGTFRTGAMGPNGDKLSVGCLVRLEASDGNAYRIRVRAVHRDVSGATKNCLKMLLQV